MRIRRDEFQDDSSSEKDEDQEELLAIDYAFMERFNDEDDETNEKKDFTYALNP